MVVPLGSLGRQVGPTRGRVKTIQMLYKCTFLSENWPWELGPVFGKRPKENRRDERHFMMISHAPTNPTISISICTSTCVSRVEPWTLARCCSTNCLLPAPAIRISLPHIPHLLFQNGTPNRLFFKVKKPSGKRRAERERETNESGSFNNDTAFICGFRISWFLNSNPIYYKRTWITPINPSIKTNI